MDYLEIVQLKGNEIEISLWKKFKKDLKNKIKSFEPYSEEEDIVDDEEDELAEELEKIKIK